ncbi:hypothetical protein EFN64_09330 [Leuconostoc citreum]|uniref:putative immunity protein n=1 Tax=Leuconostoc citreum TaxID=33964 RepID=UPI0021A4D8D7|nr:hypothetical protein [Leuconostoc citreum]MCT3073925.1 hypothetical protein [Leuconostoc citreum]
MKDEIDYKMNDFAWNEHEKKQLIKIPSPYKIKILDDLSLRIELETILNDIPQKQLANWAITNSQRFKQYFDNKLKADRRINETEKVLENRINGMCNAYQLRQAGFLANELAKDSETEISKYSARVFAQAIAVGHMRGHAIVSSDYAIKVINLIYPNSLEHVIAEREKQIFLAKQISKTGEKR